VLEVSYAQSADLARVRAVVEKMGFGDVQVQNFGTSRDVMIRLPVSKDAKPQELAARVFTQLCPPRTARWPSVSTRRRKASR
jgi:preprotein translocase subunit SecF